MNRILKSHLNKFAESYGFNMLGESEQFERFVNYSLLHNNISSAEIDLDVITTDNSDDGIDGVAIIINGEILTCLEDISPIFKNKGEKSVEVVFIQSKTSDRFDLGDFLKFKESVLRMVSSWAEEKQYKANSIVQNQAFEMLDIILSTYVTKIKDGMIDISIYYVAASEYQNPLELEEAKNQFNIQLEKSNLFNRVKIDFLGGSNIIKKWSESFSSIEASLPIIGHIAFPDISGVEEAYLVVVKAKDYVENLLKNDDDTIKSQLFEQNVRHYLGNDNSVNSQIKETLKNKDIKNRFPVLNNGITIVSPDVRMQGQRVYISNYQIVNGCQTSHVLFENRELLTEDIMITLKIVETSDEDVFGNLVTATNSQSHVDEKQFLSLHPIVKRIETYFNTFNNSNDINESRLYFERRSKQYIGHDDIPNIRIVNLDIVVRGVCAMFLNRAELSSQYPKRIYDEHYNEIFNEQNKECIFYTVALVLYRFRLLISNGNIISISQYRWHILPLVAYAITKEERIPKLNSKDVEKYCEKIIKVVSTHNSNSTAIFEKVVKFLDTKGDIKKENLKNRTFTESLLKEFIDYTRG